MRGPTLEPNWSSNAPKLFRFNAALTKDGIATLGGRLLQVQNGAGRKFLHLSEELKEVSQLCLDQQRRAAIVASVTPTGAILLQVYGITGPNIVKVASL